MTRAAPHCVAHDAFDVEALARVSTPAGLDALGARGSALLPDCAALLADAFFLFYKAHPRLEAVEALPGSARLNRRLLAEAMAARGFEAARARTLLDEAAAATAARGLVESILNLIRRHDLLLEDELLDAHRLKVAEELVQTTEAQFEALAELKAAHEADPTLPPLDDELIEALAESLDDELAAREGVQALATLRVQRAVDTLPRDLMARLRANIDALPDRLVALDADVEGFARSTGAGGRLDAAQRLALGEQLARSEKLRKLAALVGAFRSMARVQRERKVPRRGPEVYAVTLGNDPARLLASELSALRHPLLRADVRRRFLEGRLLQYGLRDRDDRGRGPMVICLDGSGSMQGPKELWAKATALTLLETARRQRRAFRAIIFCAPPHPLFERELVAARPGPGRRRAAPVEAMVEFAEHFPGGGTDFRPPLEAALATLRESRFRRGDIVFITDGEAQLGAAFLDEFAAEKKRLGFRVHGVLVDRGSVRAETLERFADTVDRVSDLTGEAAAKLVGRVR